MGNSQTRKRHQAIGDEPDSDDWPKAKRARFSFGSREAVRGSVPCCTEPSTSNTLCKPISCKKTTNRNLSKIFHSRLDLGEKTDSGYKGSGELSSAERCLSLDRFDSRVKTPQGVYSSQTLRSRDFPLPWLEALFLPEFPARSLINQNSFNIGPEIGRGSFGKVCRASPVHGPQLLYALKIQDKSRVLTKSAVSQVKREVQVQRSLSPHVFITRLYASWQTRTKLFSLLQYPDGSVGDLFGLWRNEGSFPEESLRIYAAEIACAIDFVHRCNVIYRDLKLENIVLDSAGHIQLVDFGLAKHLHSGEQTNTICGTLQYMSPCVSSGLPYSHYIDWWSFGVILHILLTGRYPYPNAEATHHRQLRFIDYSTPVPCSRNLANLLNRLLLPCRSRRLCCFEVIHAHAFFDSIDFEAVEEKKYNPLEFLRKEKVTDEMNNEVEDPVEEYDEKYEFNDFEFFNAKP